MKRKERRKKEEETGKRRTDSNSSRHIVLVRSIGLSVRTGKSKLWYKLTSYSRQLRLTIYSTYIL